MRKKMMKSYIKYDWELDILTFRKSDDEIKKSIDIQNVLLDLNSNGLVVGIEILDISKFCGVSKTILNNITKSKVEIKYCPKELLMKIILFYRKEQEKIILPLMAELNHKGLSQKMVFAAS